MRGHADASARRLLPFLALVSLTILAVGTGSAHPPPWQPSVVHNFQILPGQRLSETIVTRTPQNVDVTVVSVPADDANAVMWRPSRDEVLDPHGTVVSHFASAPDDAGSDLEHQITLPQLPVGLYQIRLSGPDLTTIQELNVGTLAALVNRGNDESVIMAFDTRVMHQRSDVTARIYASSGTSEISPSADGLLRIPKSLNDGFCSSNGGALLTASDGSLAAVWGSTCATYVDGTYFQTDRSVYRPGDTVFYRVFSRRAGAKALVSVVGGQFWYMRLLDTRDHVASGSIRLPSTAVPGYWRSGGFRMLDSARSPFLIDAATLTPTVPIGGTAKFLISATMLDGSPAAGLSVDYAWHSTNVPEDRPIRERAYGANDGTKGDLEYGKIRLDAQGNATLGVPVGQQNAEVYVFDPRTQDPVASARAEALPERGIVSVTGPFGWMATACVPLIVHEADARGSPVAGGHIQLEITYDGPPNASPSPRVVLSRDLLTNAAGYATARWCAVQAHEAYYITAYDPSSSAPKFESFVYVGSLRNWQYAAILPPRDGYVSAAGGQTHASASSTSDDDALVAAGSGYAFASSTVRFHAGIAEIFAKPPSTVDDFTLDVKQLSTGGVTTASAKFTVAEKRHLLHLKIGCTSHAQFLCVAVTDWRGAAIAARLFVDVTMATRAEVLKALSRSGEAYRSMYSAEVATLDFDSTWPATTDPSPKSYLYTAPPWRPQVVYNGTATPTPQPSPTLSPAPASPSLTLVRRDDVRTNAMGVSKISLGPLVPHRLYLIHVVAITDNGSIGDAVGSTSR